MDSDIIPSEESLSAEQIWDFDHEDIESQDWLNALREYQKALKDKLQEKTYYCTPKKNSCPSYSIIGGARPDMN